MGTRGLYGFRRNGVDKLTYNGYDSYPDGLGQAICKFIINHTATELEMFFNQIFLVDSNAVPNDLQQGALEKLGLKVYSAYDGRPLPYDEILAPFMGNLEEFFKFSKEKHVSLMADYKEFIKDSLFCEYAYIINLDNYMLEYWKGFQEKPWAANRYGTDYNDYTGDKYYPCKMAMAIPLAAITSNTLSNILTRMNKIR